MNRRLCRYGCEEDAEKEELKLGSQEGVVLNRVVGVADVVGVGVGVGVGVFG